MKHNNNMTLWVLIVVLVLGGLVYLTINNKKDIKDETNTNQVLELEGVKATILSEGSGKPAVIGNTVSMNYTGAFVDGTVFDSNIDPKFDHLQPYAFTIGSEQVIKGWDIGIAGMKVGEKRKLEIESAYAYGEQGRGIIPPNTKLIFEVELLSIN